MCLLLLITKLLLMSVLINSYIVNPLYSNLIIVVFLFNSDSRILSITGYDIIHDCHFVHSSGL